MRIIEVSCWFLDWKVLIFEQIFGYICCLLMIALIQSSVVMLPSFHLKDTGNREVSSLS